MIFMCRLFRLFLSVLCLPSTGRVRRGGVVVVACCWAGVQAGGLVAADVDEVLQLDWGSQELGEERRGMGVDPRVAGEVGEDVGGQVEDAGDVVGGRRGQGDIGVGGLVAGGSRGIGDLGYEGERDAVSTPVKKKPKKDLADFEKEINAVFSKIRVPVEWGVGHLKNWRILATRYRSDLSRIDTDIQAALGLQVLNEHHSERRLTFDRVKKAMSS